jgi:dolichol-phosphate mannosyltransferase
MERVFQELIAIPTRTLAKAAWFSIMTSKRTTEGNTETMAVSIVVPCFNEELALHDLHEKLARARWVLGSKYKTYLILVDDGSTDATWSILEELFGGDPNCTLLRQSRNLGIAAAILAGIRAAKTEIVCSIDCDCTYDPEQLGRLIPMLTAGVALVTGSPYHPAGEVRGSIGWRIFLSKSASALYRAVLRQKLYTYTSCFRVYRRNAILTLDLRRNGFLGVAELIGKLDLQGSVIVECPANMGRRVRGVSKMKVARVIFGHLHLLCQLLILRGRQAFFGTGAMISALEPRN